MDPGPVLLEADDLSVFKKNKKGTEVFLMEHTTFVYFQQALKVELNSMALAFMTPHTIRKPNVKKISRLGQGSDLQI